MATKILDITKQGPMSYRQLQQANNLNDFDMDLSSLIGNNDMFGINFQPTLYDPRKDAPERVHSSLGDWGDSMWDETSANEEQFRHLGDIRANNQWAIAKLGAGIGKGAVLAGTTFLNGTLGLVYGIGTAIDEGRFSGLWDNDVSNALQEINQKSEELMPNYRTEEEQNRPWYHYQNLGTMNFWADSFIKNLGFTIGAMYSGKLWAAPLQIAKVPAVAGEVVGSTLSAINEGRIEANNNVRDWKELQVKQVEDAYQKAVSELLPDDAMYRTKLALLAYNRDRQLADIEDRANSMGAGILLANTILLPYTNFKTFGKIYSGGFKKAVKDFADTEKRELAGRVAREGGRYVFNDYTTGEGVKQGLRTAAREGLEEMNQAWIAETAGNYQSPDSPDAYYTAMLNPNSDIKTRNFLQAATKGFMDTYGTLDRYEELVIGGLTGLLGVPTVGRMNNASASTYSGRNKWIGLSGGLFGEISINNQRNEIGKSSIEIMNKYADRISNQEDYFVQSQSFIDAMDRWSKDNNAFEYKNAEDNDDFAVISAYARVGKLSDLRQLVNKDYDNLSDKDLERIAGYFSKDSDDPTVPTTQGWRDADSKYLPETPEGRAEMRKSLSDRRDVLLKNIDEYVDSVETVRGLLHDSPQVTEDQINELAWLNWKLSRFKDRFNELKDENKPLIDNYISALNKYKEYIEKEYEDMYNAASDDLSRADDKYIKENRNVARSVENMKDFLTELQRTDNPLGLAFFIKKNNDFISSYLGEGGFELFGNLSNNTIKFEELKSLHNNLLDLSKMATASEQFNQRYKEFVNNPGAILENRQRIENEVRQESVDKDVENLISKLDDDFEGTLDEVGNQELIDTLESASDNLPEEVAEKVQNYVDRINNVETNDKQKAQILQTLNEMGASDQIIKDVRILFDALGKEGDLFALDSEIYTSTVNSPLFDEDTYSGYPQDIIEKSLETRLQNVREALATVQAKLKDDDATMADIDNAINVVENQESNEVGNDPIDTVPPINDFDELGGEEITVPDEDITFFTENLNVSDDNVEVKKHLVSVIHTINQLLSEGKSTSDILKMLENLEDYKALKNDYPIDATITQYTIDKTSSSVDQNPIVISNTPIQDSDELEKKITEDNNSTLSGNTTGQTKHYWSPIQGMLPIHLPNDATINSRYYKTIGDAKQYTPEQKKYIEAVGKYLEECGAWKKVDAGLIKEGDEIRFATDPKLNEDAGTFVILMVDNNGSVVGNLPVFGLDNTAPTYEWLASFTTLVKTTYDSEDRDDSLWIMPDITSHVNKWMIGKILFQSNDSSVQDIFTQEDSTGSLSMIKPTFAVGAVNKSGQIRIVRDSDKRQDTVPDNSILLPLTPINGQPYILLNTGKTSGNRQFVAVPVRMGTITTEESPLNTEIRKRLKGVISMSFRSTPTQVGKAKLALQEVIGARFSIQITPSNKADEGSDKFANNVKINVRTNDRENGQFKWVTLVDRRVENGNIDQLVEECMTKLSDSSVHYQMALRYINKQLNGADYNTLIAPHVRVNLQQGITQTFSNWFTINPISVDDKGNIKEVQAKSPKSTGSNKPKAPTNNGAKLFTFTYKGRNIAVDVNDWNTIYSQENGKTVTHKVRLDNGTLNMNAALAAAYAFGIKQNQDMSKPYKTQWGVYSPKDGKFISEEELETILNTRQETPPQKEEVTTTESLTEQARDLGLLTEKLGEKVWSLILDDVKQAILEDDDPLEAMEVLTSEYYPRGQSFFAGTVRSIDSKELIDAIKHRNMPFRKVDEAEDYEKWDKESEIKWLGKVLPQFAEEERVRIVDSLIKMSNSKNPEYAWGQFKNGIIYISEGASKGTIYHEAFHAVTHMLMTENELTEMFKAAENKYGKMSSIETEESLAEDFRRYIQYEEDPNVSVLTRWFRKLKHLIQTLVGNDRYLNRLFYSITKGNYANRTTDNFDSNYKLTLAKYYLNKTAYDNLSEEDKDTVKAKGLTTTEYNNLSLEEREHLLYCG